MGNAGNFPFSRFFHSSLPLNALRHEATPRSLNSYTSVLTTRMEGECGMPPLTCHAACPIDMRPTRERYLDDNGTIAAAYH